ncbi:MAG: thioredoxin family protein [Bacteroidota bacterium]
MKQLSKATLVLLCMAAPVLALMGIQPTDSPIPPAPTGLAIGEQAPDFELTNVDGQTYSLATIQDANGQAPKGYIVIFTCNTCPYAIANEQRIIELHNTYAAQGYPVVAIQPNDPDLKPGDSFEAMQARAEEEAFPFLYLLDEEQTVFPAYGATRTPEVFLLDQARTLKYHGAIDDSARDAEGVEEKFLENAIQALEEGTEPSPANTKAIGCGIKAS